MQGRVPVKYVSLPALARAKTFSGRGRLIILTFPNPEAAPAWSRAFNTEVIGGARYQKDLVILTSVPLEDESAFRKTLIAYFTGIVDGSKGGPGQDAVPSRFYRAVAITHENLAQLKRADDLIAESAEHERLAGQYRQMSRELARSVR